MKLTAVRLLVSDFDAAFRFYRDVMGFRVQWGAEGSDYAGFRGCGEAMVARLAGPAVRSGSGLDIVTRPDAHGDILTVTNLKRCAEAL